MKKCRKTECAMYNRGFCSHIASDTQIAVITDNGREIWHADPICMK